MLVAQAAVLQVLGELFWVVFAGDNESTGFDFPVNGSGLEYRSSQPHSGAVTINVTDDSPVLIDVVDADVTTPGDVVVNDYNENCVSILSSNPLGAILTSRVVGNMADPRQIIFIGIVQDHAGGLTIDLQSDNGPDTVTDSLELGSSITRFTLGAECVEGTLSAARTITLAEIRDGDNLRGRTIKFLYTQPSGDLIRVSDITSGMNLRNKMIVLTGTREAQVSSSATGQLAFGNGATLSQFNGTIFFNLNIGLGNEYMYQNGVWYSEVLTLPNDRDYIVTSNNLPLSTSGAWGWDMSEMSTGLTPFSPEAYLLSGDTEIEGDDWVLSFTQDGGVGGTHAIQILNVGGVINQAIYTNRLDDDFLDATKAGWQASEFTFPDDRDYVVASNAITAADVDGWRPEMTEIVDSNSSARLDVSIKPTNSRYAVYAVNRSGGITHLICSGRPVESWNVKRFDISTGYDRSSQVSRETRRINTQSVRRWKLNTGYLSEEWSRDIDDVVTSPKVVLHDLVENRLLAVNCTETTIERKRKISNRRSVIEYTLNLEEARTEVRM